MSFKFSGTHALLLGGSCQLALDVAGEMISLGVRPTLCYRNDAGRATIENNFKGQEGAYAPFF